MKAAALAVLCLGCWVAGAVAAEPATLADRRRAVEERFQADSGRCAERFDVNDCLDQARAQRRQALQALRDEELGQAERLRRERAQARREAVQARQAAASARPSSSPAGEGADQPRKVEAAASGGFTASSVSAPSAPSAASPARARLGGDDSAAAAERAQRAQARRQALEERRSRVQQRLEERRARGVVESPLPVPGASAPGGAAR